MPGQFTVPRPNLIESDEGFSVEVLGMTGMRYTEQGRSIFVDSEVLATPGAMAVYRNSIRRWDPPHEDQVVNEEERERVIDNIRHAFAFNGYTVEVL
jgi:hypothetical protein